MEIKRDLGTGVMTWTTTAVGVTGFRTDLARGITAADVPYSAVLVDIDVPVTSDALITNALGVVTAAE